MMNKKWILAVLLVLVLPAMACEFSFNLGGETPEVAESPVLPPPTEVAMETPTQLPPSSPTPTMPPEPEPSLRMQAGAVEPFLLRVEGEGLLAAPPSIGSGLSYLNTILGIAALMGGQVTSPVDGEQASIACPA